MIDEDIKGFVFLGFILLSIVAIIYLSVHDEGANFVKDCTKERVIYIDDIEYKCIKKR